MRIQSFINYLRFEKRYSPNTIDAYQSDLDQAFQYLSSMYEISKDEEVTHQHLRSWVVSLVTAGQGPRSINRKMSSLTSLFQIFAKGCTITVNPTGRLKALKLPKRLPKFIQENQARQLVQEADSLPPEYPDQRNQFLIMTLYFTGVTSQRT